MRLSVLAAAAVGAALILGATNESQAQIRFGIGIGNGGVYPGYGGFGPGGYGGYGGMYGPGYGGFNPGYNPYNYGRSNNYYRGNNYGNYNNNYGNNYQRRVVVVQPKREGDGLPIKVFSLEDAGTPLTYSLNGTPYTIQPGESQMLVNDRQWTISFDRGGDFGTAEYTMSPGQYWFELTSDHGWELYHDGDVSKLLKQSEGSLKNPLPPR